jgi:Protein of unknown function (DUF2971)
MTVLAPLEILKSRVDQVLDYQRVLPSADGGEELAHFTQWESCCKMLEVLDDNSPGIAFWAGEADCLNDPLEGLALIVFAEETGGNQQTNGANGGLSRSLVKTSNSVESDDIGNPQIESAEWGALFANLQQLYGGTGNYIVSGSPAPEMIVSCNTYVVSFCRDADRLDLWRAYGKDATGACLVMPLNKALEKVATSDWVFYRVAYDARSKTRAWAILHRPLSDALAACSELPPGEKEEQHQKIRTSLDPVHYLFKHEQFRTEREVRLVRTACGPHLRVKPNDAGAYTLTEKFFLGSAGCRVILGPKSLDIKIRAAVLRAYFSTKFPTNPPTVHRSNVPYQ